ncbi:MAG: hypothetical protein AAF628_02090 [Planctomycetota bacterium]
MTRDQIGVSVPVDVTEREAPGALFQSWQATRFQFSEERAGMGLGRFGLRGDRCGKT